jgi:outer membrane immunogenic protein
LSRCVEQNFVGTPFLEGIEMQRTTLRLIATVGAVLAVLSSPVFAGGSIKDAPMAAPAYNWTGLYVGVHAGWASSDISTSLANRVQPDTDGGTIGGHIGYNWQFPSSNLVIGIEGDISALSLDAVAPCANPAFACGTDVKQQSSIRGRLGLASGRSLFYITGGAAFADFDGFTRVVATGVTFPGGTSRSGWVAGLGIEYALTNNLILGLEYLHADFGTKDHTYDISYPAISLSTDQVRGRLSYKF